MEEPELVVEEISPHGNLEALVEQDERVAYLYLRAPENEEFGTKACWVRNLRRAPDEPDWSAMREGMPPMLPRAGCLHPEGQTRLDASRLRLVWLPEGDGVALLEDEGFLAVIPPWSGEDEFPGYARDCVGQSPVCWELEDPSEINDRIAKADRYWSAWEQDDTPWPHCQEAFMDAYETVLGKHSGYYAIDGGRWPPKAVARFDGPDRTYLLTLGVSLRPQPSVDMHCAEPADFQRIELAACLSSETSGGTVTRLGGYLSSWAAIPWEQFTFLAHGHTIRCDGLSDDPVLRKFTAVLLVEAPRGAPDFDTPSTGGERVSLLWVVPITSVEQQIAERGGSEELLQRFPAEWALHVLGDRAPIEE